MIEVSDSKLCKVAEGVYGTDAELERSDSGAWILPA